MENPHKPFLPGIKIYEQALKEGFLCTLLPPTDREVCF